MNNITKTIIGTLSIVSLTLSAAAFALYGQKICHKPGMECYRVKGGESWNSLFPDEHERTLVKKLNRMNTPLHRGLVIAIPTRLETLSIMDISPFPLHIRAPGRNLVKVDSSKLAWGAYSASGELLRWGPVSAGQGYCPDIHRSCRTVTGTYTFYDAQGPGCRSSVYPRPRGGAPMPYCMHFYKGYALHGSAAVPGRNASHGCVRLFTEDARWLNQEFVRPGYTKVIINH